MVRAELGASAIQEYSLGLGLRFQFPDEFFAFQDTGEVNFAIDEGYTPFNYTNLRIKNAYVVIETSPGTSSAGLIVSVSSIGNAVRVDQTTDANGMIRTDSDVAVTT